MRNSADWVKTYDRGGRFGEKDSDVLFIGHRKETSVSQFEANDFDPAPHLDDAVFEPDTIGREIQASLTVG
ncbi:MAG: hypothetical protein AAFU85_16015 [Planctomycetota bacterium]